MPINNDMLHAQSPDDVAALKARIAELEAENKKQAKLLESAKRVENTYRKLYKQNKRALMLARANRALEKIAWFKLWNASISTMNPEDGARQEYDKWKKNLGKFLKKAEEYK